MERVVYLLGAGFSAPLGIPVVRNFLDRSKDLYFRDQEKYAHFAPVFRTIAEMSVCKNYYEVDLFNIEDILSLLEMHAALVDDPVAAIAFEEYIVDVIRAYTPTNPGPTEWQHWSKTVFGPEPWNSYGAFVAALLNHSFKIVRERKHTNSIEYDPVDPEPPANEYAVITLNYDVVLEEIAAHLNRTFATDRSFRRDFNDRPDEARFGGYLAKLHGTVDSGVIVPPTWNKRLSDDSILRSWRIAHYLLAKAHHLRIIGYSLPEADNYVKYLLRTAIVDNPHLKSIDVLCLDRDGRVKKRYDDFIVFPNYRFISTTVETYLGRHLQRYAHWPERVAFEKLEDVHGELFSGH